jgi:glutamine amidotransferase
MKLAIVKYGMGNVASVLKSVKKLGHEVIITDDHNELRSADFVILPGVGSFKTGMENLQRSGLVDLLSKIVVEEKKPFLGICLGMQLLCTYGTEPSEVKGLGWIPGRVERIDEEKDLRIPHLGWNNVKTTNSGSLYDKFDGLDFYFIHSYHFKAADKRNVVLTVDYNDPLAAVLQKDNIHAMQFHPEKSQQAGMDLLKQVLDLYA